MNENDQFLLKSRDAAKAAGHPWPEYAACETALESTWGRSELAIEAKNLFGRKQSHPPVYETLKLITKEFINGEVIHVIAYWVKYPTWEACFIDRLAVLTRVSYYKAALAAITGEAFISLVSVHWSTDPLRANKVLSIYKTHSQVFGK